MDETDNKSSTMENRKDHSNNHGTGSSRYLAYHEAVRALKGNADGGR